MRSARWLRAARRRALPALCCLVVLAALCLPQAVSRLGDRELFGAVHTEAMDAVGNLPAVPATLEEKLVLRYQRGDKYYDAGENGLAVAIQDLEPEAEDHDLLAVLAQGALDQLVESGILSQEELPGELTQLHGQRQVCRRRSDGVSASFLDLWCRDGGFFLWGTVDEETGALLQFSLQVPAWNQTVTDTVQTGRQFLDGLGLEYELLEQGDSTAVYRVGGTGGLMYMADAYRPEYFSISLAGFSEKPVTGNSSASTVDKG